MYTGKLEKITYETWESFSYHKQTQKIVKEAWIYLPYNYNKDNQYNILYLSHGGWSDQTSLIGTINNTTIFKDMLDDAIYHKKIKPLLIVFLTYNNTSFKDSWDYNLAIKLTENYHNELINDLIPAVESKYSTYANDITLEDMRDSRDHRGFGGFSMGSVNTWCTFKYCLDYFRYFIPMSGSYSLDGNYMANIVKSSGHKWNDFFIYSATGTNDFAYNSFKTQIYNMSTITDTFKLGKNGNLIFFEKQGATHTYEAAYEYIMKALKCICNRL